MRSFLKGAVLGLFIGMPLWFALRFAAYWMLGLPMTFFGAPTLLTWIVDLSTLAISIEIGIAVVRRLSKPNWPAASK